MKKKDVKGRGMETSERGEERKGGEKELEERKGKGKEGEERKGRENE